MACGACIIYGFLARLAAYFALLALLVLISCLVLKCLGEWRENSEVRRGEDNETSPLMPSSSYNVGSKAVTVNYGACKQHDDDIEYGSSSNIGSTSTSNRDHTHTTGSFKCWQELYDAKICVICFDHLRNCFFVPCGHSATCHDCALRIFHEENRKCPVCRRYIGKIRKLFNP